MGGEWPTLRPGRLTPGEETRYPLLGGWVCPRAVLGGCGKCRLQRDSIAGHSVHSELLYRLRYPSPIEMVAISTKWEWEISREFGPDWSPTARGTALLLISEVVSVSYWQQYVILLYYALCWKRIKFVHNGTGSVSPTVWIFNLRNY
jgi:hypothetical protein